MSSISESFRKNPIVWGVSIILLSTVARIWFLGTEQLNLVQDEAQYWDWTRHLQLTYYSKGPLIAWIIKTGTILFGNTETGVRFGSLVGSTLTQILLYWGISRIWKRPVAAVWTLIVYNSMPIFLALGILMTTDNPFILSWTGALFSLYCATIPYEPDIERDSNESRGLPFIFITICLAVGILAKYTMLGFIGLSIIYGLVLQRQGLLPRRFWPRLLKALAAGLILGFLPTLIWNFQNDFVGYKHVMTLIGVEGKQASTLIRFNRFLPFLGEQTGLATPWWLILMIVTGFKCAKYALNKKTLENTFGLNIRQSAMLAVFFLPVWFFFFMWSFHAKTLGNWAVISYVSGVMLAGFGFEHFWNNKGRFRTVILTLCIIIFSVLHLQNLIPVPANLNPTHRLKGWTDLGTQVKKLEQTQFKDPSKVFVFSSLYDMTAALAFYVPGQPRTYCAWIDRRMNQYDLWPGPQDKVGWDAVFVCKRFHDSPEPPVGKMFKRISAPIYIQTTFKGKPARKFTVFLCYGYTGLWPDGNHNKF
ncbi:ArnT family glycosyltransferase [Maridesulfovibrio bastinii]|uniref:ArnT family glycosyltransferase n=1 Tax=Maridesulfovibrio bastinii TaxID=47157 RepID=UPI00040957F4|nr:glycosyltransferase family 39 protein [Maridesulfovibrio bastinii]